MARPLGVVINLQRHNTCLGAPSTVDETVGRGVSFMPHYKHTVPSPHPTNPERTHTLITNTDCPRCGGALDKVACEPGDLLHCPHCRGALEACGRLEDGGSNRAANVTTIGWLAPADEWDLDEECDCAGCDPRRTEEV